MSDWSDFLKLIIDKHDNNGRYFCDQCYTKVSPEKISICNMTWINLANSSEQLKVSSVCKNCFHNWTDSINKKVVKSCDSYKWIKCSDPPLRDFEKKDEEWLFIVPINF